MFSLQKRCPWEFLTLVPPGRPAKTQRQVLHSGAWQENKRWWPKVEKKERFRVAISTRKEKKKKKIVKITTHWNRLPREAVQSPALEAFKAQLDKH